MVVETQNKLRVGMITPPWFEVPPQAYGGIESMCAHLVDGLVSRGHEVILVASGRPRTSATKFFSTYSEPPSERLGQAIPEAVHAAKAARALDGLDLDVIHDHCLAGPLAAESRRTPTIVTAHGPVEGEFGEYYSHLGPNVKFVAISDVQSEIAPHLPWAGRVYNGIPITAYPFSEEKEEFALFLGRIHPTKGPDIAIRAARKAGLPLILAGKCTEPVEKEYFDSSVKPLLGRDIDWIGELSSEPKKDYLARARCLLFPIQWNEPFGIVMVEAMACGTPVVALAGGSVPEIVISGVTGFVCQNENELADSARKVDEIDPAKCRRHVEDTFDIHLMVDGYVSIYENAANLN